MNEYPKRGCMSAPDQKYHTHTNGDVYERNCQTCQFVKGNGFCGYEVGGHRPCNWKKVEGAYVPSAEEQAACEMARRMILMCGYFRGIAIPAQSRQACGRCPDLSNKSCPARKDLERCGQADAWEVK